MTQAELADAGGMSQADVSRLERGTQGFDSTSILNLANALGCSLTDLFAEAEASSTALSPESIAFARIAMQLPPEMRQEYRGRMEGLLDALKRPVPDEKTPARRPRRR
jgi:transcriptional regulator with XRE-family HTH domain